MILLKTLRKRSSYTSSCAERKQGAVRNINRILGMVFDDDYYGYCDYYCYFVIGVTHFYSLYLNLSLQH